MLKILVLSIDIPFFIAKNLLYLSDEKRSKRISFNINSLTNFLAVEPFLCSQGFPPDRYF